MKLIAELEMKFVAELVECLKLVMKLVVCLK